MTPDVPESRTSELRAVAERIARAFPDVVEEVVLTGSVSRGVADHLSDVEMLLVTADRLDLAECFELARNVGLVRLDTWGSQGTEVSRVFGYYDSVPIETVWWPHDFAEQSVEALVAGVQSGAADALSHGVALRTVGLLAVWQDRLRIYPDALAAARIEEAAVTWGRLPPNRVPDARPAARAFGVGRVPLQRRDASAPDRLRVEPRVAADEQTPCWSRRITWGQA
jgi:predicted nucleotidyltransferase